MNPMISSDLDIAAPDPDTEFDEKQNDDVAMITQDTLDGHSPEQEDLKDAKPLANDYEAMMKEYFQEMPDLETKAETHHTWSITGWNTLDKKERGPVFECGDSPWRVLFFPFGNVQPDFVSFYLEHGYDDKPPEKWYACVQFMLVLWNPNDPSIQSRHTANHRFTGEESDWGFTKFCELRRLVGKWNDEGRPLIENEAANMTAYVRVVEDPTGVLWHNFVNYDSKETTGMVGLKNQGATCYLNSLLQSLFFTNAFRKAIYMIPTENENDVRENSAYALQRLFYHLQHSNTAVSTGELTTSFGWESRQIFEQQDVQELSRVLMDRMEDRMKGTEAENALADLFVGTMKTYISCINVDYESARPEDFWDIQLNVRGNVTLDDSFKDYIQVETLEGDNKYAAEGHGLQDARKGVIFEKFPDVLHLQLKRFEYNFQADAMTKVYDRYEFPEIWDASPYLSEAADKSEPHIYHLHGVLVHSGDLNAGHYYAFLKPTKGGEFYRFDDDRVTRATKKEAMDENFGGDFANMTNGVAGQRNPYTRTWSKQRFMSAYMLVYIRESRMDKVLKPIKDQDVPQHLDRKIKEEKAEFERRRKEREEAHLYMNVVVGSNRNFAHHQGFDIYPHPHSTLPADDASIPVVRKILQTTTIDELNESLAKELATEPDLVRCWGLVSRQNQTVRPDTPLGPGNMTVSDIYSRLRVKPPYRLWVEVAERNSDGQPDLIDIDTLTDPRKPDAPILLFLKHFDAENQTLLGQGHLYIDKTRKISDLGPIILERMKWETGTQLKLFEEIKSNMIESMNTKSTFAASELQHGDIVCFQRVLDEAQIEALEKENKRVDPPSFYQFLAHRVQINFTDKQDPESEERHFSLVLSKIMNYDEVADQVGQKLGVDPTYLRFTTVNANNGKPRQFVKRQNNQRLDNILTPQYGAYGTITSQRADWLFYEVLDMPLAELETKKLLKVSLLSEGISKEEQYEVLVPKSGTIADVFPVLQAKAKLSEEAIDNLRLYEVHTGKVYKELSTDTSVHNFNEWVSIYAEQMPEDEINANPDSDRAVYAFHFDKEPQKTHGVPFKFVVKDGEKFAETRARLSKRTGIKGKNLEKIKFAVIPRSTFPRPDYLEDEDVLSEKLVSSEDLLGLDHVNKARNTYARSDAMMIR